MSTWKRGNQDRIDSVVRVPRTTHMAAKSILDELNARVAKIIGRRWIIGAISLGDVFQIAVEEYAERHHIAVRSGRPPKKGVKR